MKRRNAEAFGDGGKTKELGATLSKTDKSYAKIDGVKLGRYSVLPKESSRRDSEALVRATLSPKGHG